MHLLFKIIFLSHLRPLPLSLSLSVTHLRASLPGGFARELLVVQLTLLQQVQDVLSLHTNGREIHKKKRDERLPSVAILVPKEAC